MSNKSKISDEYQIIRYKKGIKLVKPDEKKTIYADNRLSHILQVPFSFYLLNSEGKTQKINDEGASVCGFDSIRHSMGKSVLDVSKKESASKLISNCQDVIQSNEIKIFEEDYLRKDGMNLHFLSVKAPWYDQKDSIIGICGFSVVLGKHELASSLSTIAKLGLLKLEINPTPIINGVHLSKREMECLHLTIKGYTAKRIARQLKISHRTVEEYLTNLRIKLGAASKAELIEMTIDCF